MPEKRDLSMKIENINYRADHLPTYLFSMIIYNFQCHMRYEYDVLVFFQAVCSVNISMYCTGWWLELSA